MAFASSPRHLVASNCRTGGPRVGTSLRSGRNFSPTAPFVSLKRSRSSSRLLRRHAMTRHHTRFVVRIARFACIAALLALAPSARADGGPAFLVKDINTADNPYLYTDSYGFMAVGNTLYFAARDERNGRELWKSDATGANAVLVKDLN